MVVAGFVCPVTPTASNVLHLRDFCFSFHRPIHYPTTLMARLAEFKIGDNLFKAGINKIDRDKIYGYVEEHACDVNGDECHMGSVLGDGITFVLSGSTALKKVDDAFYEVDKSEMKTVYMDGSDAELIPSIFEIEVPLKEGPLDRLLDLQVDLAYQLSFDAEDDKAAVIAQLKTDKAYYFVYNYRADYEGADAFLISNGADVFALAGKLVEFQFLDNETIVPIDENEDDSAENEPDPLDFGMF